ncbi:MAG: 2-oxo-4-hydroxy-4-carboxy-5-ureidoimidazoline decarboxylase [Polaromonas sp.]|nr:2-oxo-4-hydroxy-4-carboxy-5-ureidoimidazoline decarboxylase [Polaromonas sp.]
MLHDTTRLPTAQAIAAPLGEHNQTDLVRLNGLPADAFTALLADVFEHSPWVAERSAAARPFSSVDQLHRAMCAVVQAASDAEQLQLLRAHPELAGKQALDGELTEASALEQSGAGLTRLAPADMVRISALNAAYLARHGFPFIVCVGHHTQASLFQAFERRVGNTPDAERTEAMAQVGQIARLRLDALFPG